MIKFSYNCTGCESCSYVCPKGAISFECRDNGYSYPKIDHNLCINCGICEKSCAIFIKPELIKVNRAFSFSSKDNDCLAISSSGGFAFELASKALIDGDDVFGVVWDIDNKIAKHAKISISMVAKSAKSKYTKADMGDIFASIKESLLSKHKVVVFGLPCEIFALSKVFRVYSKQILFVELLCGGSLSPLFINKYLSEIEESKGKQISNIDFRSKHFGTETLCTKICFKDGTSFFANGKKNAYISLLGSNFVRPSCINCQMGYLDSCADIKIGDFFGKKRGNGRSIVLTYAPKDNFSSIIASVFESGNVQEVDKDSLHLFTECRSKNVAEIDINKVVSLQESFYRDLKEGKSFINSVYNLVIHPLTFKKKVYFFAPYWIKKKVTK